MAEGHFDAPAEMGLLAGIYRHGFVAYIEVADIITPQTFGEESNQLLWKAFTKVYEQGESKVDIPLIYAACSELGLPHYFDKVEEKKYLRAIVNYPVEESSVRKLASRLRKLEIIRDLEKEIDFTKQDVGQLDGSQSIDEILAIAENRLLEFSNRLTGNNDQDGTYLGYGIDDYIDYVINNPRDIAGISSGNPIYDKWIGGGFRRGSVNVVAARPKVGKTAWGINTCLNICENLKIPCLYLDMEMEKEDFWNKTLANLSGVEIDKVETGRMLSDEIEKVKQAADRIKAMPFIYVNISGKSFNDTLSLLKRLLIKKVGKDENGKLKDCLVVYDYFRLNESGDIKKNVAEYQSLGFQIIALKAIAKKYGFPVLTFVQLNRDGITKEDSSTASGGDRIIWLCTNYFIFKATTDEERQFFGPRMQDMPNRALKPTGTSRYGGEIADGDFIGFYYEGHLCRLREGKTFGEIQRISSQGLNVNASEGISFGSGGTDGAEQ